MVSWLNCQEIKSNEMISDKNKWAFFKLLEAGLWEKDVQFLVAEQIDWHTVYKLSEEQSVLGLVLAGIDRFTTDRGAGDRLPHDLLMQWIGVVQLYEQKNKSMNDFVSMLIEKLRLSNIYALIVKGQGIAQCYEKPYWRACGDVDLLLSDNNYSQAKTFLKSLATSVEREDVYEKHFGMNIKGWTVELHGSLRSGVSSRVDKQIDTVQNAVFYGGDVRSWTNGKTQINMPGVDCDVFFVFTHILKHFYREGVGLRQLCDWCRLLWVYRNSINKKLLEKRLLEAGIMSEWKAFAAVAVDYLGMPVEAIPFYTSSRSQSKKARKIVSVILETGNFGHNKVNNNQIKHSTFIRKTISLWQHTNDSMKHFFIFPLNTLRAWWYIVVRGFRVVAKGS